MSAFTSHWKRLFSLAVPLAAAAAVSAVMSPIGVVAPPSAAADTVTATTLPIPDEGTARWYFSGDKVVGLIEGTNGGNCVGHFSAYSLAEAKALWHVDQVLGNKDAMGGTMILSDAAKGLWYVGKGPLSQLDLSAGAIKWTIPCEQSGYLILDHARLLSGDRLLIAGSKKCDQSSDWDATKEPQYSMVNTVTGKVIWQYQTKSLEYDNALGYWARAAQYQGAQVQKDKRQQLITMLVTPRGGFDETGVYQPDRLAVAGEQWESVRLSDGVPLFKTTDKPGILRGAYDGTAFFRDGDKFNAYTVAGASPIWTFDLKGKGVTVHTADDLIDQGHGAPDGMGDLLVAESDIVSRVSAETGRAAWTLKRGGMSWWGSKHAFLTESGDKVFAYDWRTGAKMWEAKIDGKPKPVDAGDAIVFVSGDKSGTQSPPFRFTTVKGSGGQVFWSRKDMDSRKIVDWQMVGSGQIRLTSDKGAVVNLNVADGSPATTPTTASESEKGAQQNGYFVTYLQKEKKIQCHDYSGKLVWERKGESSMTPAYRMGKGCVVWASKDGTVEIIGLADGASMWKQKVDAKDPHPAFNADGTYMVLQNKKEVSIVKLGS